MAQMNRQLTGVDTLFLPTAPQWAFVSSSLVREVATLGGDVTAFLPATIAERDHGSDCVSECGSGWRCVRPEHLRNIGISAHSDGEG